MKTKLPKVGRDEMALIHNWCISIYLSTALKSLGLNVQVRLIEIIAQAG